MKTNKLFLFLAIFCLVGAYSCKKDKAETTSQKLQHKWTVETVITNDHDNTGDDRDTTYGTANDYVLFNSNGTVETHLGGDNETSAYSLINDNTLKVDDETYTIITLTSSKLVLYGKDGTADEYYENTISCKR